MPLEQLAKHPNGHIVVNAPLVAQLGGRVRYWGLLPEDTEGPACIWVPSNMVMERKLTALSRTTPIVKHDSSDLYALLIAQLATKPSICKRFIAQPVDIHAALHSAFLY